MTTMIQYSPKIYHTQIQGESQTEEAEFIRSALATICCVRKLFDDTVFNTHQVETMNHVRILEGVDPSADTLVSWIEHGILDALKLGYLSAFQLCIHSREEAVLETYLFVRMERLGETSCLINPLMMLTKSIQNLPCFGQEVFLSVRLSYNDSCPPKYQPISFKDDANDLSIECSLDLNGFYRSFPKCLSDISACASLEGIRVDPLRVVEVLNTTVTQITAHLPTLILDPTFLACDSGCKILQLAVSTTAQCSLCFRIVNLCCYGYSHLDNPEAFSCYTCQYGTLDSDLLLLMRIRLLWSYISHYREVPAIDTVFDIFQLRLGEPMHEDSVRLVYNKLFQDGVLQIADQKVSLPGSNYFVPKISEICDVLRNRELEPFERYWIQFIPLAQRIDSSLKFNIAVQSIYFSNHSRVKSSLRRFRDSFLTRWRPANSSIARSPHTVSKENRKSSLFSIVSAQKLGTSQLVKRNEFVLESISFEESLQLLSQSESSMKFLENH